MTLSIIVHKKDFVAIDTIDQRVCPIIVLSPSFAWAIEIRDCLVAIRNFEITLHYKSKII